MWWNIFQLFYCLEVYLFQQEISERDDKEICHAEAAAQACWLSFALFFLPCNCSANQRAL